MIYLLAPAFNEEKNLKLLAESVNEFLKEKYLLVIVDDGSKDNTLKEATNLSSKYPIRAIGYKQNRGPGYAFRFGLNEILKKAKEDDIIITLESDNTSDLSQVKTMIARTREFDVVIASPLKGRNNFVNVESYRKFLTIANHVLLSILFNLKGVESYSNFFRAYRAGILKKAQEYYGKLYISEEGFSAVTELLVKLNKIGAKMTSVEAKVDWSKREGKSKMKIFKYLRRQIIFAIKYKLLSYLFLRPERS